MPSPTCTVDSGSTLDGVDVVASDPFEIALSDVAGVTQWSLTCIGTDDGQDTADITDSLVIDQVTKTATGNWPADPCALIFQSKVNNGLDVNGRVDSALTTTLGVYVLTTAGLRLGADNETTEGDSAHGWTSKVNALVTATSAISGVVAPTADTIPKRDGSAGLKAAYLDSGAASDLTLKRNGTTKLTIGASTLTVADSVTSPFLSTTSANPSSTGLVRGANNSTLVAARNSGNSADIAVIGTSTNAIIVGGANNSAIEIRTDGLRLEDDASVVRMIVDLSTAALAFTADAACTSVAFSQTQAASGTGVGWLVSAQQGAAGQSGGTLELAGGAPGTNGTGAGGDIIANLRAHNTGTGNTAKFSWQENGTELGFARLEANSYFELGSSARSVHFLSGAGFVLIDAATDVYLDGGGSSKRLTVNSTGTGFNGATPAARPDYTVTNHTNARSLDETGATLVQVANTLGTLINDLIAYGLLQ